MEHFEKKLETIIRGAAFPNPAHKEALRERLFGGVRALEPDELDLVAGGVHFDGESKPDKPGPTAGPDPGSEPLFPDVKRLDRP